MTFVTMFKIRVLAAILLVFSTCVLSSESMIIGHRHDIPVDCGYQAYFKPDYAKSLDRMDGLSSIYVNENILHLRHFQGEKGDSISIRSLVTAYDYETLKNVQYFSNDNLSYTNTQEAIQYRGGCIDDRLIASSPQLLLIAKVSSELIYRRTFLLPEAGGNELYSFYAHVTYSQHDFISDANKNTQVSISLSCQDYKYTREAENPDIGTHKLTIPMDEFNLSSCSAKNQVELEVVLRGNGLRLEGLQTMYYEVF